MSFAREVIKFLENNAEKSFTVPTVIDKMKEAFFKGELALDIIPPKMYQGFKDAKNSENQELSNDASDRFRRSIYIALNIAAKKQKIEKDQEEGMLRYYFTKKTQDEKIEESDNESKAKKSSKNEEDLYDTLADYLKNLDIGNKRIDEKRARNTKGPGGNHWLYPDMIGVQHIVQEHWQDDKIFELMESNEKIKFWSFEVKIEVNISDVREKYFQAVANSSWANFGYFVVANIKSAAVSEELNMLANRHGIGVILLDRENPEGGAIKIPAKERKNVDWEMLNRLAVNSDIKECLKKIHIFCKTKSIDKDFWNLEIIKTQIIKSID